jgi:hypothetical protein
MMTDPMPEPEGPEDERFDAVIPYSSAPRATVGIDLA